MIVLADLSDAVFSELSNLATSIGKASRTATVRAVEAWSNVPLVGAIVKSYAAHYEEAHRPHPEKFSQAVRDFFARWSINFSAEYYEAKDRGEAAKPALRG